MILSAPENTPAPAISGNPAPAGGPAAPASSPPPAKPGLRGLWANPEKRDTSAWNIYYYYFRQIARHSPSCKLKNMKWIGLAVNVIFFGIPLLDSHAGFQSYLNSFHKINEAFFYLLVIILTFVPVVVLGNAFKLKVRNIGFMTSRAKEQPPLLHLMEYTSCDRLIGGVFQSMIYTYSLLLLFLLPSFIAFYAIEAKFNDLSVPELIAIPFSMLIVNFLVMQRFCFRLDTLLLVILVIMEMGCDFKLFYSFLSFMFRVSSRPYLGNSPWFLLLYWTVAMVYFPLAAADTLEYGVGKNSARIRILQLGIIIFDFISLIILTGSIKLSSQWNTFFAVHALFPAFWVMVGFAGLLCSSLSAASFRTKARFIMRTVTETKKKRIPRFLHPASPCSTLSVCVLEIVVVALFIGLQRSRNPAKFWSSSLLDEFGRNADSDAKYMLMTVLMVFSAFHFALALMYHFRRKAPVDKQPWMAYARFNGLFFVFLIASLLPAVFSANFRVNGIELNILPYPPMIYYPVSILCLIASAVRESVEIRAAKKLAEKNGYGAPQETLEAAE